MTGRSRSYGSLLPALFGWFLALVAHPEPHALCVQIRGVAAQQPDAGAPANPVRDGVTALTCLIAVVRELAFDAVLLEPGFEHAFFGGFDRLPFDWECLRPMGTTHLREIKR